MHATDTLRASAKIFSGLFLAAPLTRRVFPVLDLIWMSVKLLGRLSQGSIAPQGCQCHFRFECWQVIASLSSGHLLLLLCLAL